MNRCQLAHLALVAFCLLICTPGLAEPPAKPEQPVKVYVPYEQLRGVFENEKQGVFLPYAEFQRLWQAAQGRPAKIDELPAPYVLSIARLVGKVGAELATVRLELTIDVLTDQWVDIPLGLSEVAVQSVAFAGPADDAQPQPLLRVQDGSYRLLTRGRGRRVVNIDFVRQLVSRPGLNELGFRAPPASITTLELLIPEENIKVDVVPMLAATTATAEADGRKATRLQAFLGAGGQVSLSWKPSTQAAEELEPVVIAEQLQQIHVDEAVVTWTAQLNYVIRRRGIDTLTVTLPGDFRVTAVEGANISKWQIAAAPDAAPAAQSQVLSVKLFSPVKDDYSLTVRMERFLQEDQAEIPLSPVVTHEAVRHSGLLAVWPSPRRSVELRSPRNLARVEVGRLGEPLRNMPNIVNYRFISTDYSARLAVTAVAPRVGGQFAWSVGVEPARMELLGRLNYAIERVGLFQVSLAIPEPWQIDSVGPADLVERHELTGAGPDRRLNVLFRRELVGPVELTIAASAARASPGGLVDFRLPAPLITGESSTFAGTVCLFLSDQLRAELESLSDLAPISLRESGSPPIAALAPAMAYRFRAIDRAANPGCAWRIAVKPPQVSAVVHRLVDIQPGTVAQEAVILFSVRYAPTDTFYIKMPAELADAGVEISGANIKETPRVADSATRPDDLPGEWATYRIVLQAPVTGEYLLKVTARQPFVAGDQTSSVRVLPILAAGPLSDQNGFIAVAKADTLAVGEPLASTGLTSGDPGDAGDLPYQPHRQRKCALAFRYSAPPFELTLPVAASTAADVFTVIATTAIIEQVLARDGTLNGQATFVLSASRADRLIVTLPPGGAEKLYEVTLNGQPIQVEHVPGQPNQRAIRLGPTVATGSDAILQITYGCDAADAAALAAPSLPPDVPVRQTIWRLWSPRDERVLHFGQQYAQLSQGDADQLRARLLPSSPAWQFAGQGRAISLLRPGAPATLTLWRVGSEGLAVVVWAVVLLVGAGMSWLRVYNRLVLLVFIAAGMFVLKLFAPLLATAIADHLPLPVVLVAVLWIVKGIRGMLVVSGRRSRPLSASTPPTAEAT